MDKVVYFLGAGFSAPLGLPVMRDFLIKSKDMYFENPDRYKHLAIIYLTKYISDKASCQKAITALHHSLRAGSGLLEL